MRFYVLLLLLLMGCGGNGSHFSASSTSSEQISTRIADLKSQAPLCEGYVSKANCDQGDVVLFSGLLCLSGESVGCDTAGASIDVRGKVWRSPKAVGHDTPNSSSRDMFLGALAYCIGTKDSAALERMSNYVGQTGKICEDATDGRCDLTENVRDLLDHTRLYLNLPTLQSRKGYSERLAVQVNTANEGFELHLIGVQLLLLKKTSTWNKTLQYTADRLVGRQPHNPFFTLISQGTSDRYTQLMLEQIPASEPKSLTEWSIERSDSQKAWQSSVIWEFIFLNNLSSAE